MILSPKTWLRWAACLMPHDRSDWLSAMEAELIEVSDPKEQIDFIFGFFKVALSEWVRSRKGLSYIARAGSAAFLLALSAFGIYSAVNMSAEPEMVAVSRVITSLCLFYMCCAALLVTSPRRLQIFAGLGFALAIMGWAYFGIVSPNYSDLPIEFMTAINLEVAGLMAGLFMLAVYLDWLYRPSIHDA